MLNKFGDSLEEQKFVIYKRLEKEFKPRARNIFEIALVMRRTALPIKLVTLKKMDRRIFFAYLFSTLFYHIDECNEQLLEKIFVICNFCLKKPF